MKNKFQSKSVPRGTRTIWRYLGALFILFTFAIGQMWGACTSNVLSVAASTDNGKSASPRYTCSTTSGVGYLYFKKADASSGWSLSSGKVQSSVFGIYTENALSSITVYGDGTGANRTLSSVQIASTFNSYTTISPISAVVEGTNDGKFTSSGQADSMVIEYDFPAARYIVITVSGNVNVSSVKLVSCTSTSYTIQYNSNGGSGTMSNSTNTVSACTFTAPSATKVFDHWNDKADDSGANYAVGASVGKDITLYAQWADKFTVTYDKNGGTGTMANTTNEIVACTFTAPSGKGFKEWNTQADGKGTKYEVGATVSSNLDLYAIWKAVPTTIFDWTAATTNDIEADDTDLSNATYGTLTTGTSVKGRLLGTNTITKNNAGYKLGNNDVCIEIQGTSDFQEGDTVIIRARGGGDGERGCAIASSSVNTAASADTARTNLINDKNNERTYTVIVTSKQEGAKIRVFRMADKTMYIKSIKVIRPAERPISSTTITLSDVKVNNRSISSDSLTTLVSAKSLLLKDEYAVAPVIKFNEHTVITYDDELLPATKVTDKVYTVTATVNGDGKWQAQQTINSVAYIVTAEKVSSAKVYYYDGATKLGEEIVAINGNPVDFADFQDKDYATFVSWYNNSDLAEEHKIADIAALVVTKDTTVYGKWNPAYATSINIEQWVLDNGVSNSPFRAELTARHYKYATLNNLDSLNDDPSKDYRNYAYLGQKVNKTDSEISFLLKTGSTLNVRFGHLGSNINVIYGTDDPIALTSADYANESPAGDKVYEYTATADVIVKFQCDGTSTSVFKQIMINEPIATVVLPAIVTLNPNGGKYDDKTENTIVKYTGTPLVLGDATPADADHVFAGWYDGEDQINAAAYVPTANVELLAHYSNTEYTVTYEGGEDATGSMDPVQVAWDAEYTLATNAFAKEGHVWSGWVATYNDGVEEQTLTITEGKITMPKYNVTVTAQWTDNSKVAQIVETSAKYASFAEAYTAATVGQTIQLLQNCSYSSTWTIDKDVTLDLNGKNLTGPASGDAVAITSGGKLTVMDGTATVDPTINNLNEITYASGKFIAANYQINVYNGGEFVMNSGWLVAEEAVAWAKHSGIITINNGVLESNGNAVVMGPGNQGWGGYTMNIHGGIILGKMVQGGLDAGFASMCVYHPNIGTLNIDGGKLISTNGPAVVIRGGESNITGGEIIAQGDGTPRKCGDASQNIDAVGIAVDFKSAYPGVASTDVAVSGTVDVNGQAGAVQAVYVKTDDPTAAEMNAIGVSGGTFNTALTNAVCAEGYVPVTTPNAQGKFTVEPKDGVSIIKAEATATVQDITGEKLTGIYKGAAHIQTSTGYKLNQGNYFMVQLKEGENFKAGDVVEINVVAQNDGNGFAIYKDASFTSANLIIDTHDGTGAAAKVSTGINVVKLPNTYLGSNKLYVGRPSDGDKYLNAGIDQVEVFRAMYPILTAITFDGVVALEGAGNTFTITLPEATTDLNDMEVVPTIIRNAAHATTPEAVISNEGAWVEGANTYRVMDKDGDYTDYTITITLQAEAPVPSITIQPAANTAYCAGSEPTLSVEASVSEGALHYAWFKEAGETDEAVGEDAASYTIASAGTYYVIVTNHVEGKLDKSVTSDNAVVTMNAAAAITTQPSDLKKQIEGDMITLSVVATNATGYQWYSCDDKEKTNPSLIAGAESADYEFAAAAGFYYCAVNGLCGVVESNVAQVTVKRTAGCQYIAATSGYETTESGLYICGTANSDGKQATSGNVFATASENAKAIDDGAVGSFSSQYILLKFPVDIEEFTMFGYNNSSRSINNVRVNNEIGPNIKFTSDMEVEATKTATKEGSDISMTAVLAEPISKDNYVYVKFSSSLEVYRICYTAALAKPVVPTLLDQDLCAGDAIAELDGTSTKEGEGTLSYQWFNGDTDEPIDGATNAKYTPTEDGKYYVQVTNAAAGRISNIAKSNTITITHFAGTAITSAPANVRKTVGEAAALTVEATGKNLSYVWFTCDDAIGTNPEAIVPAETNATLNVIVPDGIQYYMVVVSSECGAAVSAVAKVEKFVPVAQVVVDNSVVWDLTTCADAEIKLDGTTSPKKGEECLMANIEGVHMDENFHSESLVFAGEYIYRTSGASGHPTCATYMKFETSVAGLVRVHFAGNGANRCLRITSSDKVQYSSVSTGTGNDLTEEFEVAAGEIELMGMNSGHTSDKQYMRFYQIEFFALAHQRTSGYNVGDLGTVCLEDATFIEGASLYELQGLDEHGYLAFDEILSGELEAGKPYLFEVINPNKISFYKPLGAAHSDTEIETNGMIGTFAGTTLYQGAENYYYFSGRHIWRVNDFTVSIAIPAHRCYVDMDELQPVAAAAPAPGRRRVTLGVQGSQVVTGMENLNAGDQPVKVMINGQLFILRGEKMYDATGRLVK